MLGAQWVVTRPGTRAEGRQELAKPSHRVGTVNANIVEARVVPKGRRQGESAGEGAAADVHNDGIRRLRAGEQLAERCNEFLEVPLLVEVGVEQNQIVGGQVPAWGIEVGLTAANGFECSVAVDTEERAAS